MKLVALPTAFLGALFCLLLSPAFAAEPGARFDTPDWRFPESAAVINVIKPPYNAKGDGQTDDTDAIQRAMNDLTGQHKILYLPNGTYLVSSQLAWKNKTPKGANAWGRTWIQGQNVHKTVIRLKPDTFTDPARPQAILSCRGFGSADWFHNYIQDVSFVVGPGNPGAIGLRFYSNNTGAVRAVVISSDDRRGHTGLDLASDMNGPLLVQDLEVLGFDVGIRTGAAVNSQTFERITLRGQSRYGFLNAGQSISIHQLLSENDVPAFRTEGPAALLGSLLRARSPKSPDLSAAVESTTDAFYARDLVCGFPVAVVHGKKNASVPGGNVSEFMAGKPTSPFGGPLGSLRLPIEESPKIPVDDPDSWAIVDNFGADPSGKTDSSDAIQKAVDSGATTLFFPGFYALSKPVTIRGKVRRLLGTGAWIDYFKKSSPDFIIADGDAPAILIEHFAPINGGIRIDTDRTVILRSLEARRIISSGKGKMFLEDVCTDDFRLNPGQQVWARHLNIENEGTHLTNDGGNLWILGYKTERGGTLLHTKNSGQAELFGNFSYTTTAGRLAPMFLTEDASVFAFFHEVCFNGNPFATLIRETRRNTTREIKRGEGSIAPYIGRPEQ